MCDHSHTGGEPQTHKFSLTDDGVNISDQASVAFSWIQLTRTVYTPHSSKPPQANQILIHSVFWFSDTQNPELLAAHV